MYTSFITLYTSFIFMSVNGDPGFSNAGLSGAGICGAVAGCKTPEEGPVCFGTAGENTCKKCLSGATTSDRNVMTIQAYTHSIKLSECRTNESDCPDSPKYFNEMAKHMVLMDDRVAISPQGAVFKDANIPKLRFKDHYQTRFCGLKCFKVLKKACLNAQTMENVREWCLTALEPVKEIHAQLKGPPSFILFLAAKLVRVVGNEKLEPLDKEKVLCSGEPCEWFEKATGAEYEENAALVAAAATTVLLTGDWFETYGDDDDSGFSITHSIWLVTFAGRLRIRILPNKDKGANFLAPGTKALCARKGLKMQTTTGAVYAAICALFKEEIGLRYRLEIVPPPAVGSCFERTAGMVHIRPGDWIPPVGAKFATIGSFFKTEHKGVQEYDDMGLTTIEITNSGVTLYPFNAVNVMKNKKKTACTDAIGFGWNGDGFLGSSGLTGVAGICQFQPVW